MFAGRVAVILGTSACLGHVFAVHRTEKVGLLSKYVLNVFFFFQAEDGIRDDLVTGVQTCALPILWKQNTPTRRLSVICLPRHESIWPPTLSFPPVLDSKLKKIPSGMMWAHSVNAKPSPSVIMSSGAVAWMTPDTTHLQLSRTRACATRIVRKTNQEDAVIC